MSYITPADVGVSDNWQDHIDRNSFSPGTDYMTAYGTDCRMPASGTIVIASNINGNGDGRKLRINCDDGRELDMLHASWINGYPGQYVTQGQKGIFISGSSGFGDENYYDPHVHVTLRERPGLPDKQTINFEDYLGEGEDDMNAEQDNRLKNVENLLKVADAGYGWPEVGGKAAQDVQNRIYIYDEHGNKLYDVFQLLTNTTNSINRLVYIVGGIGVLSLAGIITLVVSTVIT